MTLPPLPYAPAEPTKRGFGSGAGRVKGQKSTVTLALKEAILLAAEEAGERIADAVEEGGKERPEGGLAGYLTYVATTDVKSFCGLLGRVLPMTIKGEGPGGGIVVEIVRMAAPLLAASSAHSTS